MFNFILYALLNFNQIKPNNMRPVSYIIENPYEARLVAAPIEFKTGKEKRRERRKKERK